MKKKISWWVIVTGAIVGLSAVLLTHFGNPANMGFCIACFLRDIAGSLGLHSAGKVQYVRPEIIGLVLGAFVMSVCTKEFRAKSGSAPALRFVLGAFVMIGALAFLGCPLRMCSVWPAAMPTLWSVWSASAPVSLPVRCS